MDLLKKNSAGMPDHWNERNGQVTFAREKKISDAVMNPVCRKIHLEETKPLSTKVAGHQNGMLDIGNGLVLKVVQEPPRGMRELNFYKAVFDVNCQDELILTLRNFLPAFHGTVIKDGVTFMIMDNACAKFHKPSVLDIKLGRVTSDPEAPEKTVRNRRLRYRYATNLGFSLVGMMMYNEHADSFDRLEKKTCLAMPEDSILLDGLGNFFGLRQKLRKDVIRALIPKIKELEKWFLSQKSFAFYASSLLIIYGSPSGHLPSQADDTTLQNDSPSERLSQKPDDTVDKNESVNGDHIERREMLTEEPVVELRFIDFAHVFQSSDTDDNVLFGIQYLLRYLDKLLLL